MTDPEENFSEGIPVLLFEEIYGLTEVVSEADKTQIIKNARESIRANIQDLDPDIRQLVNDNFKTLLWK